MHKNKWLFSTANAEKNILHVQAKNSATEGFKQAGADLSPPFSNITELNPIK